VVEVVVTLDKMQHLVDLVVDKEQLEFHQEHYLPVRQEMLVVLVHQKEILVEVHIHMLAVMHLVLVVVVLVLLAPMDQFLVPHQDQEVQVE
jgi:hypothetical protein